MLRLMLLIMAWQANGHICMWGGVIIRIYGTTIIADYCLESITINQLIGDLDHQYRVSYDVVQQIK